MQHWSVYLIRTARGTLYTGVTSDVERRFAEHAAGGARAAKALRGRGPLTLEFHCEVGNRSAALQLEAHIKKWPRYWKEELICGRRQLPALNRAEELAPADPAHTD
ncbi:GIY-YIG nuclease family protein [Microbulbifer yueqingensis]|uniref:Putative endonuclease n=1 Tax=Microbulbifer yueqingensis TaxID=658219 RepID=A0A1G8V144_9GAMM|nr:GIY-YIG nuclease family protein [Microbulbifer yueqingensis]SDJ59584.1 putative endonuclease [Microbulbifer yueqingensis]